MSGLDGSPESADDEILDPRRWVTLSIVILTVVLGAIDTSVLNVSIPTILRDLDTTVPTLQWVITGYSLTYASLLIVGGRLGDIYGHRRLFLIGVAVFGAGSLIASQSHSVGELIIGEAVIEGIGAALMMPASLSILSTTFRGRERATAFAAWGASVGAAVAFGPVLGGFLTTNYSWRWSFGINVLIAPFALVGAVLLVPRGLRKRRTPIDLPGAALTALGMFLIVFALSEGGEHGWLRPINPFTISGATIWSSDLPIGIVPVSLVAGIGMLAAFVVVERSKERRGTGPLFEFSLMRHRTFRYGLLTLTIMAMGQLGLLLTLPLFLQDAMHLSAQENGLWLLPMGLFVIVGSQIGARLTRLIGVSIVVRIGLVIESVSMFLVVWAVTPSMTFVQLLPGLAFFGVGVGFASSQLTGVILSEVGADQAGIASGAASTAKQLGGALGAAVIATLITVQTTKRAVDAMARSVGLSADARQQAISGVRDVGVSYRPPAELPHAQAALLERLLSQALADASRIALGFAAIIVGVGAVLSFLLPRSGPGGAAEDTGAGLAVEVGRATADQA